MQAGIVHVDQLAQSHPRADRNAYQTACAAMISTISLPVSNDSVNKADTAAEQELMPPKGQSLFASPACTSARQPYFLCDLHLCWVCNEGHMLNFSFCVHDFYPHNIQVA